MPIQSYLMMYFAGAGWQIGKRKISAIPNDQFNKMSANDLLKGFTADLRETIPTLERSMNDITPLVGVLVEQYGEFIKEIIRVTPSTAQNIVGSLVNPKGALVPPAFGPELEKLVTGGATDAQFLAFAKIFFQQELDKLNAEKSKTLTETIQTESRPFTGPEINPATGEQSTFLKSILNLPDPASHIQSRPVSNVSKQSLILNRKILQATIRKAGIAHNNAVASFNQTKTWSVAGKQTKQHVIIARQQLVGTTNLALKSAVQAMSNFMKMHGARF